MAKNYIRENLVTVAEKTQQVFDAGKKSQYDAFWDDFQMNGNRRNYYNAFFSRWNTGSWSDVTFQPKYPIICDGGANATADTDVCRAMLYGCYKIKEIKQEIIIRNTSMYGVINDTYIEAIHDLTIENITYAHQPIYSNPYLKILNIKGEIAVNGFDFSRCPMLNKESITKIINILSPNTSNLTVTLSKTAVYNAFPNADVDKNQDWKDLVATKSNWTISLV